MNREEKRRRFNEALVNMLYPQPPQPEEEEKPVNLLEEEFDVDLISDDLEKSSCSTSDDNDNDDGGESGTLKLTRAQRKRLRMKKLKEDASRRGKIIGPLLPSSNDDGDVGVRQNAAENVVAASDKSGEQPGCASQKKGKQRRIAKRLAKERSKLATVEHCDPK